MRVAIIPTGVMELGGLAAALQRLFPEHEFLSVPKIKARPGVEATPHDQSNTHRVSNDESREGLKDDRARLVAALAGAVYPPERPDAADLAIVVDDLELINMDQPGVVIEAIRAAVRSHVERQVPTLHERYGARRGEVEVSELRRCLRERASFHLAVPMPESWLFADPRGPANSGVRSNDAVQLKQGIDPEQFETDDPAYSADDGSCCKRLHALNQRKGAKARDVPWVIGLAPRYPLCSRERHPKAYLQWLCRDPSENYCTRWKESKDGVEALRRLDWHAVLANPTWCTWLRALVDDLADGLDELPPVPGATGMLCPLTARKRDDPDAVLRNL